MNSRKSDSKAHIVFFKTKLYLVSASLGQIEHPESGIIEGSPFSWGTLRVWGGGAYMVLKMWGKGSFLSHDDIWEERCSWQASSCTPLPWVLPKTFISSPQCKIPVPSQWVERATLALSAISRTHTHTSSNSTKSFFSLKIEASFLPITPLKPTSLTEHP